MITQKNRLLQVILDLQAMMMSMGGSKEQKVFMVWDSGMKEQDSIRFHHDTQSSVHFKTCLFLELFLLYFQTVVD